MDALARVLVAPIRIALARHGGVLPLVAVVALLAAVPAASAQERKYELVTPAGESGFWPESWTADPDGSHAYYAVSEASLAGSRPDGVRTDVFTSKRESTGWVSTWITPYCPQSRTVFGVVCDETLKEASAPQIVQGAGGRVLFAMSVPTGGNDTNGPGGPDAYVGNAAGITLVTADPLGTTELGLDTASITPSADLETIAFVTSGALLPIDTDDQEDVYVHRGGHLELVTATPDGALAPCASTCSGAQVGGSVSLPSASGEALSPNGVSADGRAIFFTTSKQVTPDDSADAENDLYVRDSDGVRLLSGPGAVAPTFERASTDGSRAFLTTVEALGGSDGDSARDLYAVDAESGTPTLVSGGTTAEVRFVTSSNDGSHAWFIARDPLADAPDDGAPKLYEWDGDVEYVASLPESEETGLLGANTLARRPARAAVDGSAFVFATTASLVPEDGNSAMDVYRFAAGELTLLTSRPAGQDTAPAHLGFVNNLNPGSANVIGRGITSDASAVFVTTRAALSPDDTDEGYLDVYEVDAVGGIELVSAPGAAPFDSFYRQSSTDGRDVFFATSEALVGWDRDSSFVDLYDARRGGGFPEPPPAAIECESDACQGPVAAAPQLAPLARLAAGGGGTPPPRTRFSIRSLSDRQLARLARGKDARVSVRVTRRARVSVVLRARVGRRAPVVGRGAIRARRAGTAHVRISLTKRGRVLLSKAHRLRIRATVRVSGTTSPRRVTFTLEAPRAHR